MSQKDRKKWLAALAIVLLLAAFCVVLWHTGLLEKLKNVEQLQVYLASHTPWSQLIFLGLQLCSVIIAPIPSNIIAAAGGAAFGVWPGFLITLVAVLVGSCTTFTLARTLCKDFADRVIRPKLSPKYLELLDRKRDTFLALTFFFPLFPDDLLCIMAGLTEISFRRFFIIVLLTRPWGLLAANIFGSSLLFLLPQGHSPAGHRCGAVHRRDDLWRSAGTADFKLHCETEKFLNSLFFTLTAACAYDKVT